MPRPTVIGNYFKKSNTIDCHNEMRQFFLKLEKHWITTDGFFRIITTFFGICITDAWRGYRHHMPKENHRHANVSIIDFADMLLKDMLENTFERKAPGETVLHIPDKQDEGLISASATIYCYNPRIRFYNCSIRINTKRIGKEFCSKLRGY